MLYRLEEGRMPHRNMGQWQELAVGDDIILSVYYNGLFKSKTKRYTEVLDGDLTGTCQFVAGFEGDMASGRLASIGEVQVSSWSPTFRW